MVETDILSNQSGGKFITEFIRSKKFIESGEFIKFTATEVENLILKVETENQDGQIRNKIAHKDSHNICRGV